MQRSKTTLATALAAIALLGVACDDEPPAPPASPSTAFPAESPAGPTPTLPTSGSTASPVGDLTDGAVQLRLSGDLTLETELAVLISAVGTPPPGGFALVWTGEGDDPTTVGLGGSAFVGIRPTSPTLVLTIAAPTEDGISTWVSNAGECEVELEVAQADRFAGSFTCDDVRSGSGELMSASGTFEATG